MYVWGGGSMGLYERERERELGCTPCLLFVGSTWSSAVDGDFFLGSIVRVCLHEPHMFDDLHSCLNTPEYGVFPVEPRRRGECDKELGTWRSEGGNEKEKNGSRADGPHNHNKNRAHSLAKQTYNTRTYACRHLTIRVGSRVRHRKNTRTGVFEVLVDLIFKLTAEYTLSTPPSPRGVSSLDHKVLDDTMEDHIVIITVLRQL